MNNRTSYLKILSLALIISSSALAQTRRIDSLQQLIQNRPDDSVKVMLYFELGKQYEYFKSKERIAYFVTALELAQSIDDKPGIKKVYQILILNLFHRNMYDLALSYCNKYIEFLEKEGMKDAQLENCKMLGILYSKQGRFEEAFVYYRKAASYFLKKNDSLQYAKVMSNISIAMNDIGNTDSSLYYSRLTLHIFANNKDSAALANSLLVMASNYITAKQPELALIHANKAMKIYTSMKYAHGLSNSYTTLGEIAFNQGRCDTAVLSFQKALHYGSEVKLSSLLKDCHLNLSKAYACLKQYDKAYESHTIYKKYDDTISVENLKLKMLEMEVTYDISKKEEQLKATTFELRSKAIQQNLLTIGIIAIFLLLLISVRAYRNKKKTNEIIEGQKKLVEERNKDISDSINYARKIQEAILPPRELKLELFPEAFVLFLPKDVVSGDFYWFAKKDGNKLIAAVDCTGHGVPGAFMSMIGNAFLNAIVNKEGITSPAEILNALRKAIVSSLKQEDGQNKDGMDIALLSFDEQLSQVKYAGAHNPLWIIGRDDEGMIALKEIKASKQPVGMYQGEVVPFNETIIQLKKGDTLYIFTDGYADQFGGEKGKKFRYKKLQELLLSIYDKPMPGQEIILLEEFNKWKGELEQVDDVCLIGIRS